MAHNSRTNFPQGNFDYNAPPTQIKGENIWTNRYLNIKNSSTQQPMELGTPFITKEGKCYRFMMNDTTTAFAHGSILSAQLPVAPSGTPVVTAGSLNTITGCTGLEVGSWRGGYAYMSAATGTGADGQIARVVWNTATTIHLDRNMVAATGVTLQLWHPYKMRLTPATLATYVNGVAIGVVDAELLSGMFVAGGTTSFSWMQTAGLCDRVLVTAAPTENGMLTASATVAGSADPNINGETVDDVHVFAHAVAGLFFDVAVPAYLHCE